MTVRALFTPALPRCEIYWVADITHVPMYMYLYRRFDALLDSHSFLTSYPKFYYCTISNFEHVLFSNVRHLPTNICPRHPQ
jgi:hypothetical protein